jgi:hypothetical protein
MPDRKRNKFALMKKSRVLQAGRRYQRGIFLWRLKIELDFFMHFSTVEHMF